LLTPALVRLASRACFALATVIGLVLAWHGGWPIQVAGVRRFWREAPGPAFNALLARTARFQVLFAALLCVAIVLG